MYFRKVIIPVALAGICAAAPAGFRIEETIDTVLAREYPDHTFTAHVYGPGVDNLSASDPYARYQWGLRNDGELQSGQPH